MSPEQFRRCSPFQFAAAVAGWNLVHGSNEEKPEPMSEEEFDDLVAKHMGGS